MSQSSPRKTLVRVAQDAPRLHREVVHQFPETPHPFMLRRLINGDQLAVAASGSHIAMMKVKGEFEIVSHTCVDAPHLRFERSDDSHARACILRVGRNFVVVWGHPEGRESGIWFVSGEMIRLVQPMDKLIGFLGMPAMRMPFGQTADGDTFVVSPCGAYPLDTNAQVDAFVDGKLLITESVSGIPYSYMLSADGITNHQPLQVLEGFRTVRPIRWGERIYNAGTCGDSSWLRELPGDASKNAEPFNFLMEGEIEQAWSSPNGQAIALLIQVRSRAGLRRLYLGTECVHEGLFSVQRNGLIWSANGRMFAACTTSVDGRCIVVTPTSIHSLPDGQTAKEVVVRDDGGLAGMILSDGTLDTLLLGRRQRVRIPLAWNMHANPDGSLVWNEAIGDEIFRCTNSSR